MDPLPWTNKAIRILDLLVLSLRNIHRSRPRSGPKSKFRDISVMRAANILGIAREFLALFRRERFRCWPRLGWLWPRSAETHRGDPSSDWLIAYLGLTSPRSNWKKSIQTWRPNPHPKNRGKPQRRPLRVETRSFNLAGIRRATPAIPTVTITDTSFQSRVRRQNATSTRSAPD